MLHLTVFVKIEIAPNKLTREKVSKHGALRIIAHEVRLLEENCVNKYTQI